MANNREPHDRDPNQAPLCPTPVDAAECRDVPPGLSAKKATGLV